ncbi:MAG: hypothetical protein WED34_17230, partial [Planctomycetales bacterium]
MVPRSVDANCVTAQHDSKTENPEGHHNIAEGPDAENPAGVSQHRTHGNRILTLGAEKDLREV